MKAFTVGKKRYEVKYSAPSTAYPNISLELQKRGITLINYVIGETNNGAAMGIWVTANGTIYNSLNWKVVNATIEEN